MNTCPHCGRKLEDEPECTSDDCPGDDDNGLIYDDLRQFYGPAAIPKAHNSQ